MLKRFASAILVTPVILLVISLFGLLFAAVGRVINLALVGQRDTGSLGLRMAIFFAIVLVSLVGIVGILNWSLAFAHQLGRRMPMLRQAASDSVLGLASFAGVTGASLLTLGALGVFPTQRLPLLVCGAALTVAASSILIPRLRRSRKRRPPDRRPPSGALGAAVPRGNESTAAHADRVASGGAV